jgi:8-oxo-dGTP pyrophosphatase MutT (NUDIX family)
MLVQLLARPHPGVAIGGPVLSVSLLEKAMRGSLPSREGADPPGQAAAVSAIFRDGRLGLEVLLIRRAERNGDPWSGHMAFPGGRRDAGDTDLLATTVRETLEEIGLDLRAAGSVVGVLENQSATTRARNTGMWIRPYVFHLVSEEPRFELNHEVTETIWAPVAPLMSGERTSSIDVTFDNVSYTLPAYDVDGRIVWGITYRMLQQIIAKLRAAVAANG